MCGRGGRVSDQGVLNCERKAQRTRRAERKTIHHRGHGEARGLDDRVTKEIGFLAYSRAGLAPGKRVFRNLIWPLWFDSCSQTWNHLQ